MRDVRWVLAGVLVACGGGDEDDDDGVGTDAPPVDTDTDPDPTGETGDTAPPLPTISQRFAHSIGVADVLFAVDSSYEMGALQQALATEAPALFDALDAGGVDWHAGVVVMDMDEPIDSGRLRSDGGARWIDPSTANPQTSLARRLDTAGHPAAQGRDVEYNALGPLAAGPNAGFARERACTAIVSVTDADDESGDDVVTAGAWLGFLRGLEETKGPVAHHVLAPLGASLLTYENVTTGIGGLRGYPDTAALGAIGEATLCLPQTTFVLSRDADPATLVVHLEREGGVPRPVEAFDFDAPSRTLTLAEPPLHADDVVVTFVPL